MRKVLYRRRIAVALTTALLGATSASSVYAGYLRPGQSAVLVGHDVPVEDWRLDPGAYLMTEDGAVLSSLSLSAAQASLHDSSVLAEAEGAAIFATDSSNLDIERTRVSNKRGTGMTLFGHNPGSDEPRLYADLLDSHVEGYDAGARIIGGSEMVMLRSEARATAADGVGAQLGYGRLSVQYGSLVSGSRAGVTMALSWEGQSILEVMAGRVASDHGPAVIVSAIRPVDFDARISLKRGGVIGGESGRAITVRKGASLFAKVDASTILGDITIEEGASGRMEMMGASRFRGGVQGDLDLSLGPDSQWEVTNDSRLRGLSVVGARLGFSRAAPGPRLVSVDGDLTGGNSVISMAADVTPDSGWHDHLGIKGNVSVDAPIWLDVTLAGVGGSTDLNGNGAVDRGEGLSLVHVAGNSEPTAFQLVGGSVVAGAYQYTLHAFGPEESAERSGESSGSGGWDYRLANKYVDESGGGPVAPPSDDGEVRPIVPVNPVRPAVAPELASYLSTPSAIFGYGMAMSSGLHQRLGDLRGGGLSEDIGGEVFVRHVGAGDRFASGQSFVNYGFDFDQRTEATQFGGSIVALDGDNGSLRAGWAYDHGRISIVPHAVDGASVTRLRANGTSFWMTWKHGGGLWVDAVVDRHRLVGSTDTASSGASVGRIKSRTSGVSVEVGIPYEVGRSFVIEPRLRAGFQSIAMDPIRQANATEVRASRQGYGSYSAGLTVSRPVKGFSPFFNLSISDTVGSGARLSVSSAGGGGASRFTADSPGGSYALTGGAMAQVTDTVQLFGDGSYKRALGGHGFSGWSGQLGVRVSF